MTTFADVVCTHQPLIVPGVYDGISARVAHALAFPAVYIGSYATSAATYGIPDLGYIGLSDMADMTARIADVVDCPIIVDGENGWGTALQVARAIRTIERAGACAVHIEDHEFGKHLIDELQVLPLGRAVDKIHAAVDARADEDFAVIARTDLGGDEAVDRALAFQTAGASAIFIAGDMEAAQWDRVRAEVTVPVVTVDSPQHSADDLAKLGADVILYWGLSVVAALDGLERALGALKTSAGSLVVGEGLRDWRSADVFFGINEMRLAAAKYGLTGQSGSSSAPDLRTETEE